MPLREDRAPVWAIWLLIAFGAVQPLAWWLGVGLPRHAVVLVPLLVVWITLLAIAAIATRRITSLSRRLSQKEQDHSATLTEVDQLQTQNAMLDIIARSVDVPWPFRHWPRGSPGSRRATGSAWHCSPKMDGNSRPTPRACSRKSEGPAHDRRSCSRSSGRFSAASFDPVSR